MLGLALVLALVGGCGCFAGGRWHPFGAPVAPPPAAPARVIPPVPVKPPEPTLPPVRPAEAPRPAPSEIVRADNDARAKRLTEARGDLKTGLTALELRAVTACLEPGGACVDNQGLIDRARALDVKLALAVLDPRIEVNWAEVTTVLRAVVDSAMKGLPK